MQYRDVQFMLGLSRNADAPGYDIQRHETWNLFAAVVPLDEFDLEEAVNLATEWRQPHGADSVNILNRYVVGRFEDRTLFAVITQPLYLWDRKLVTGPEYFTRANAQLKEAANASH